MSQEEFVNQTLLVVNSGSQKKRFILQKLNKMGLQLIVLNKEKNWASSYADHWVLADTNNHDESIQAVDSFLKQHPNLKPRGVITYWEDDVLLTSKLSEHLGLIGIPFAVANQARNKYLFREFCRVHGLPAPKHKLIKSEVDLQEVIDTWQFPLVVKPIYGSSSAYVVKVEDATELAETFYYVKNNLSTEVESALISGFGLMIEQYIDGDEVDIDLLIQNGKVKFSSVADNYKPFEPFFIETTHSLPSHLPEDDQEALVNMAEEVLERLGVQNGCIHFEAKMTRQGPMPLEANLRLGGDEVYPSVKEVWGVDLIESLVRISFGTFIPKIHVEEPKKQLLSQTLHAPHSGIVSNIDIDPALEDKKYVEDFYFGKKIGDPILIPPAGYEYLGWLSVSGDNLLDAQDNLNEALELLEYDVVKFDPASSIGKTERRTSISSASLQKELILKQAKLEKIRRVTKADQRKLFIGIAGNIFDENDQVTEVESELASVGLVIEKVLSERGYKTQFFNFNKMPNVIQELKSANVDLVFNVCERINNSSLLEPHAASLLDILQIPYTGSNPFTLALCMDKIRVKKLLSHHNIPTPNWDYVYSLDDEIDDELQYPLIVKPAMTDNSIGVTNESVVTNKEELKVQINKILTEYHVPALIEEYIAGDEYDVSILGSDSENLKVLPLSRSVFTNLPKDYWHIYSYDAKWGLDKTYQQKIEVQRPPKKISSKLQSLISEIALDTYNILDCHDYGRIEIRVDEHSNPYVLELNPNPAINAKDCLPSVAKLVGMDYGDFLEEIISLAINRYKYQPPYHHLQQTVAL